MGKNKQNWSKKADMLPKILIFFSLKKFKIFSGEMSWNNISDWAVKWLFLISIKSKPVSQTCSIVTCLSYTKHTSGSSPFNKQDWAIQEWPMCNRRIADSSFFFVQGKRRSVKCGNILWSLFSGNLSQSNCHSSNIIVCMRLSLRRGWWAQPRCHQWGHP